MKLLIVDFAKRWWWVFVLYVVFTAVLARFGQRFIFTPALLICLLFDAQRGVFRAVRPLPVSRRAQAVTWWLLGVIALPLLSVPALAVGTLFFIDAHAALLVPVPSPTGGAPLHWLNYEPWFAAGVAAWMGLGFAALCFLLCSFLPTRPPNGPRETIGHTIVAMLWGLSMSAGMLLAQAQFTIGTRTVQFLPKMPEQVALWHWVLFALVPVAVVFSFIAAPDVLQRRTFGVGVGKNNVIAADELPRASSGLVGVPLFLVNIVGGGMGIVTAMALIQGTFYRSISTHAEWEHWWQHGHGGFVTQIVIMAVLFASICGEWAGLRSLRALPISTPRLTALLLAAPVALGFVAALFTSTLGGAHDAARPWFVNFLAQAIAVAGFGSLALGTSLYVTSGLRILVMVLTAVPPALGFLALAKWPFLLALVGIVTFACGLALLHHGLRKSSAFYRARPLFGINFGQPMAIR